MNTKKKPSADAFANLIRVARGASSEEASEPYVPELNSQGKRSSLPIDTISLRVRFKQPRQYFDTAKLAELENSIRSKGIEEPLIVRPLSGETYELVDGERRYRAAKNIGLAELPVDVRELDDKQALEYSLTKFLLSEDLNPVEQTHGILDLLSLELGNDREETISLLYRMQNESKGKVSATTTRNVAGKEKEVVESLFAAVGMSWDSFIRHRLPLLKLPEEILDALMQGKIEYTKAQTVARVKNVAQRKDLLQQAVGEDLSLSEIRERIKKQLPEPDTDSPKLRLSAVYQRMLKAKLWEKDPKKWKQAQALLDKLDALLSED
ncbi:ParB/RepB/Spo0J family partition protein [Phormidium tenue FACHB-886]|nr:ParB/RepB/Spo0J family partition protein [Phormidium tenue FACHB-886]